MATNAPRLGDEQREPVGDASKGTASASLDAALKLVIWDLDETLWAGTLSEGEVELDQAHAEIVRTLNRRGIMNSICSKNDLADARARLEREGLWDEFVFPSISWSPKGQQIARIIEDMQLRPANVLFIDDNPGNLQEALHYVPGLQTAAPTLIAGLLELRHAEGKDDEALTRLAQYRVLEQKAADRTSSSASNEEFLRTCDIRVRLSTEGGGELQRLAELINRSNQLNFTKTRTSEEQLQALFADPDRETGYVQVSDRYGDYGVCGFFSVHDGRLTDFVFSCRILHMGVEQWLYQRLGSPQLEIVGEVASEPASGTPVDWITLGDASPAREAPAGVRAGGRRSRVLLKGGCDLWILNSFLGGSIKTEFTFPSSTGAPVHPDHTDVLRRSTRETLAEHGELIDRLPFLDRAAYGSRIVRAPNSLGAVIMSVLMDYTEGLYQLRGSDFVAPFWQYDVDVTDPGNWPALERSLGDGGVDREFLEWFAEAFEFQGPIAPEPFKENIRWLAGQLPKTKLVLINGAEIPNVNDAEVDRHLRHREMNRALEEVVAELENVTICDVREFVSSPDDVRDNIRHYNREMYKRMAERVTEALGGSVAVEHSARLMRLRRGRRKLEQHLDRAAVRFRLR